MEAAVDTSGLLGTRRNFKNIRWYEYAFLALGILATLVTDGLTIVRLVDLGSFNDPDFAYGILILVHSIFLLAFLVTGIFFQRASDIIAFLFSAFLLTIYVVAHFFARKNAETDAHDNQPKLRLVRLIFTMFFNVCFIPLGIIVIKDYRREEFSKRVFGAFAAARLPLQLYNIFACVARISTMLSISALVLNLYNFTGFVTADRAFLIIGIPLAFLWLGLGIGMIRLESYLLALIFYVLSLFQIGFLSFCLYTAIDYSSSINRELKSSTTTTTSMSSTKTNVLVFVPILNVLYICVSFNIVTHIASMVLSLICARNFNKGLKDKMFNNKLDQWFQAHWPGGHSSA